jgi:hypothetical protein
MKLFRLAFLLPLLGCFFPATPCLAGLQQQDESIRKFIQAVAARDQEGACQNLEIQTSDGASVSLVQAGIEILGGKKIDDVTRTNIQYNWVNGTETFSAAYHIRTGDEGFYLYFASESVAKKRTALEFSFEKSEANPWEVRAINFSKEHWMGLLAALLVASILGVGLLIWVIIHFAGKKPAPPKIPV